MDRQKKAFRLTTQLLIPLLSLVAALVGVWIAWLTLKNPSSPAEYVVTVAILNPEGQLVHGATVRSSLGITPVEVPEGYRFKIPSRLLPKDKKFTINVQAEQLTGNFTINLGGKSSVPVFVLERTDTGSQPSRSEPAPEAREVRPSTGQTPGNTDSVGPGFEINPHESEIRRPEESMPSEAAPIIQKEDQLILKVSDLRGRPVSGAKVRMPGYPELLPPTDAGGISRVRLVRDGTSKGWSSLELDEDPLRWFMVEPWDAHVALPGSDAAGDSYLSLRLGSAGDQGVLADREALKALIFRINTRGSLRFVQWEGASNPLLEEATRLKFKDDAVSRAIETFKLKTRDGLEQGLADLYSRDYVEAGSRLSSYRHEQERLGRSGPEAGTVLSLEGQALLRQGLYLPAAELYRLANARRKGDADLESQWAYSLYLAGDLERAFLILTQLERRLVEANEDEALKFEVSLGLAQVLRMQGSYKAAEQRVVSSLYSRKNRGRMSVILLNELGGLLGERGEYARAEGLLHQAQDRQKDADRSTLIQTAHELARLYSGLGRYDEAQKVLSEALTIDGLDPCARASIVRRLALVLCRSGKCPAAAERAREAFDLARSCGKDHPELAAAYDTKGEIEEAQGSFGSAENDYKVALSVKRKSLKPNHLEIVKSLYRIGHLYGALRKYSSARQTLIEALGLVRRGHPYTAVILNELARLHLMKANAEDYRQAEEYLEKALSIQEEALSPDHLARATTCVNFADLYSASDAYIKAEDWYLQALGIQERALGRVHIELVRTLEGYARLLHKMERHSEASDLEKRAQAIAAVRH
jgi:tetratricopeptide (TPR) repeat protein